jgi:two-component system sensor kinase FixL
MISRRMATQSPPYPLGDPARILAAIVAASSDAIISKDLNGVVESWNHGAEQMYGYTAGEMIGRSVAALLPPERAGELAWLLEGVKSGQRIEDFQTTRLTKYGRRLDVLITLAPRHDAGGRLLGATVIARDITEQRRAEFAIRAKEARWRAVIDAAVDGIILIDSRGVIEAFNPAAERMFGYSEAAVLGRNVNLLMPSPYHEEHDGYIRHYLETGEQKIIGIGREVIGLRRDGATFPVHLAVGEMRVDEERHFIGILHDLTERVALEERLREQTALARLGEMAAVIAHEVKNPLAAVRGALQVIGGRLPEGSRDGPVIKEIIARLDGLNDLIKDLLLFARTPTPRYTTVDLKALVAHTVEFLAGDPAMRQIHVDVTGDAGLLQADAELLTIVVQNLLLNAAQAMRGEGTIAVTIGDDGRSRVVRVADQGPGIPVDTRQKLFQPFFTTKARGTGLGLPTARRLVEAHHGTIVVDCPSEGGTVVTITLPKEFEKLELRS